LRQNTTSVKKENKTLENFKSFISEEKHENYRVVVISNELGDKAITAKRMEEEANKLEYPYYVAPMDGTYTVLNDGVRTIHKQDDEKGFEIHTNDTVIFIRGTPERDSNLDLITQFQRAGYCVVNSRECVEVATDKYRSYLRLKDFGLTQPKTVLIPNEKTIEKSFQELDTKLPIVLKTLRGSKGVGVLFVESKRSLNSIVQLIHKQDEDADLLIQEYIKTEYDVRVHILGGKFLAAMKRPVIEGDFRSNVSQGSVPKKIQLTELEMEESLKAAKAVGGYWTAVDFIPSKNRDKEPPFMLEVNSSPGTEGIEDATGMNIAKDVIQHFAKKKNRYTVPTECGHREVVSIKPWGEMIAKFDTGNSASASTIHADKIDVNGKKVTWSYAGKTSTNKIERIVKVDVGGLNNYTEKRYAILLDIEFAGSLYKNVEILLDNREGRSPILFNRDFMKRSNVMVNPQRKYIVTTNLYP